MRTEFYPFAGPFNKNFREFEEPYLVSNDGDGLTVEAFGYSDNYNYISFPPFQKLKAVKCVGGMYLEHPVIGDALVVDAEIGEVDWKDAPDFSDAHYSRAVWAHSGEELTEDQLDQLGEKYVDELNQLARSFRDDY